jgi:hypothetical protein
MEGYKAYKTKSGKIYWYPRPPSRMRPKYLVMRRGEAVGLWYDPKKKELFVGGFLSCDPLAQDLIRFFCRNALPPVSTRIPLRIVGGCRFRRNFGFSHKQFRRIVGILEKHGVRLLDVVVEPVRKFSRLVY